MLDINVNDFWLPWIYGCHGNSCDERFHCTCVGTISLPLEDADLYGVSVKMSIDDKVGNFSVSHLIIL